MIKNLLSVLVVAFTITASVAQKKLEKGYVKMEITNIASDNEQVAMQLEMMKGSQTEIFFTSKSQATKMNMMGGMVDVKTYTNTETKTYDMLMDAMGTKMWVNSSLDEAIDAESRAQASKMKIDYDKSKTKKILGYNCYAVTVSDPDGAGEVMSGYVTEEITSGSNIVQGLQSLEFSGFPLEFSVKTPIMSLTMSAIEIKDTFDEANLVPKTDGFKKMTMEEFRNSMGGMGGF